MKKVLLVLAVVAVYAFSITTATANVVISEKAQISIVADDNISPEGEKETKKETKKATTKEAAKGAACGDAAKTETKAACGDAKKADCSTAVKKACCGEKK